MYAVVKTGGKQYKVKGGEILNVERLDGEPGDTVILDNVLMISDGEELKIGNPLLADTRIVAEIVCQGKGPKITVFKMKRRKGYRNKTGHRQLLTTLRIREISA